MAEPADPFQHTRMTLGEHLKELRTRLFRGVLALVVAFAVCWFFYERVTDVVLWPMYDVLAKVDQDQREKFAKLLEEERALDPSVPRTKYFASEDPADTTLKPELTVPSRPAMTALGEGFSFAMRVTLYAALVLGMPVFLWQMWQFIAAGLYAHERRAILRYFPVSLLLFLAGVAFGYSVLCPISFRFMVTLYAPEKVVYIAAIGPYLEVLQGVTLALGLVFELPLVMYALVRIGLVERRTFVRFRPYFVVAAFVIGGILTPPDPFTQFLLAVPMILLYEVGLLWTWFLPKPKEWNAEPERPA
jgi:sec-independent protein translocase protein TatC